MAWAIALILFGNWVLGIASGAQLGWWIHLMFVGALISLAMGAVGVASMIRHSPRVPSPVKAAASGDEDGR